MSQERTEGIVVRGVDFSETSRIVTFLTPDRGRLACMAKGVRRPKSELAALLDTFNRLEIQYYWKDGRSVQQLAEATLIDDFAVLKADFAKAIYAAFPLELAHKVAHENEPSQVLYNVLVTGLNGLAIWAGDVRSHCAWQAFHLLAAAGFEPALDLCVQCGRSVGARAGFSYEGGVTCTRCRHDVRLSAKDLATLRSLASEADSCPDIAVNKDSFDLLGRFAARQLDAGFRSLRVIEQVVK